MLILTQYCSTFWQGHFKGLLQWHHMNHAQILSTVCVCVLLSVVYTVNGTACLLTISKIGKQSPYCEHNHISHEAGHPQRLKLPLKKYNYSEGTIIWLDFTPEILREGTRNHFSVGSLPSFSYFWYFSAHFNKMRRLTNHMYIDKWIKRS